MRKALTLLIAALLTIASTAVTFAQNPRVTVGIEVLVQDSLLLLEGKRVGVVCNHTSLFPNGTHLVDSLQSIPGVLLSAIFTPEHGFRGKASAGEHVSSDHLQDIPVYSLYGNTRRPTRDMLKNIDVLIFDMQDVGARFYTYISTMGYCMEAAAEYGVPIIICDRPNPICGDVVQGPVLDPAHKSFVGMYPIPVRHGMTVAEIALMAQGEQWLKVDGLELHAVRMRGWRRDMWYDETGLPWIAPSPNLPDLTTAVLYPGMCLVEGTNISEGRGTEVPFQIAGAPFLNGKAMISNLESVDLPGFRIEKASFTPRSKPGAANPKYDGQECGGVRILVVDRDAVNPIFAGVAVLASAALSAPGYVRFKKYLTMLAGHRLEMSRLSSQAKVKDLLSEWSAQAYGFTKKRTQYLLYD